MRMHLRTLIASLLIASPALAACGGDDDTSAAPAAQAPTTPAESATPAEYGLVTPDRAAELAVADGVTVIDVRTPDEFAAGYIDGATLIDFYEPDFADAIAALDRDGEYLLYCRSGSRSGQASALMAELGFDQVYDLDGGMVAYEAAGLVVTK
jgi:rhodanese-related sulfurtransferase